MPSTSTSPVHRTLAMLSLVLAGEAVFIPAFHLGRYFKTSLLDVFAIDERQLGELYAWYGGVAMACYLLGGPIADRCSPRKLLAGSLLATAAGGVYMATLPGFAALRWLFAFWGASTILAFWAPLIRATREWGGHLAQGSAFGLLDGGRGLASALVASAAVFAFGLWVGEGEAPTAATEAVAVKRLLWFYAACCVASAVMVWCFVPDGQTAAAPRDDAAQNDAALGAGLGDVLRRIGEVLSMPAIWLQTVVVIAAYIAFKTFDYYGYYCEDAYGLDKQQSASLIAWLSYLRVGAALAAGWIADRWLGPAGTIIACFAALLASYGVLLLLPATQSLYGLGVANLAVSFAAFFGLRGIYFALLDESGVPERLTGTAVGVVSFVGFTPEIFMPLVTGGLVQSSREAGDVMGGYDRLFTLLAVLAVSGLAAAWLLLLRRGQGPSATKAATQA